MRPLPWYFRWVRARFTPQQALVLWMLLYKKKRNKKSSTRFCGARCPLDALFVAEHPSIATVTRHSDTLVVGEGTTRGWKRTPRWRKRRQTDGPWAGLPPPWPVHTHGSRAAAFSSALCFSLPVCGAYHWYALLPARLLY